jgi:aminoglycoside phosphotransferase family enzyme
MPIYLIGEAGAGRTSNEYLAQAAEKISGYHRCTKDEYCKKMQEIESRKEHIQMNILHVIVRKDDLQLILNGLDKHRITLTKYRVALERLQQVIDGPTPEPDSQPLGYITKSRSRICG